MGSEKTFVMEYCSKCVHRDVCKYREKLESVPALREIQAIIGSCKFFISSRQIKPPKPVVEVEKVPAKPKIPFEELKNRVVNWIAAQPYGTVFTVKELREALNLSDWRGIAQILKRLAAQGWLETGERQLKYGTVKEYKVVLNKKPSKEEIERVKKAEIV